MNSSCAYPQPLVDQLPSYGQPKKKKKSRKRKKLYE